jgi:transcription antitermination factor NusG
MRPEATVPNDLSVHSAPRWYAVYTKHQHEKKCADLLRQKSIEVYLPLYQSARRWQDRKKVLSLPLFPSYVFLRSDLQGRLDILNTPGVFFIVGNARGACPIADTDIESMRVVTKSRLAIEPHPVLKSGDHVRICRGPLAGVHGILTRVNNQDRLVLSVEPLRRAVSVEVNIADVEKTGRNSSTSQPQRYTSNKQVASG